MEKSESLARVEKLTRAVLSSEGVGVPLLRFESDYRRMTRTEFPWKEYGFKSARDMLISMETVVEFKFNDQEGQFYLLPVHVTINGISGDEGVYIDRVSNGCSKVQNDSSNSSEQLAITDDTADTMPSLVEAGPDQMFSVDHFGRVSVFVGQSKEKPAKNFWNKDNLTTMFSPFGNVLGVSVMPNHKSGFVRYKTIEEAKRAIKGLHNTSISADGNKLLVRPGFTKQQKIGQPIICNNKQPVAAKSVTTAAITKVTHEALHHHRSNSVDGDDDDDAWDDGLLPRNIGCNGDHDNTGIVNGMSKLDVSDQDILLREMFVSEVISPGLIWLKDAKLSTRDLQLLSLSIEVQQKQLRKLATWTLPKEGTVYCINAQEVNKADRSGIKWSRVIVNKVLQSSEQVEIRYVDTGVLGTLSMSLLYVLPLSCQLREVPPAVMPCYLWGVASSHDNREWWPLDCQLLWSLIRNKKVFAKVRSDIMHLISDNVERRVPVELFFDADGKDDIRDHLISKGHFIVLTDTSVTSDHSRTDKFFTNNACVETATPTQEGMTSMWKPSTRRASTDPLSNQSHSKIQSHNQSLPVTSPLMWRPTKMAPQTLSFSDQ